MRILKNIIYNGTVQISGILLNLVLMPYITRVLGKEALGINSFGLAITSYFALFGNLGIVIYGAKAIAEKRDNPAEKQKVFAHCITYQFLFNALAILLFNLWLPFQDNFESVYFLFNIVLLCTMTDLSWTYTGMERFDLIAIRNLTIRVAGTSLIFLFVKNPRDLALFIVIQQGILFISNIVFWLELKKIGLKIQFAPLRESLQYVFRPAVALFIPSIFTTVYMSLNKVMLGYLSDIGQVAIYDYPNRLVRIAITLIGILGTVMMPRLAYLKKNSTSLDYESKIKQMLYASMLFSIPAMYLIILTANELSLLMFSSTFQGADLIMQIVAPTIITSGLSLYIVMVTQERIKHLTWAVATGSVFNLILNFILIPRYAAIGAAFSTIITEVLVHILLIYHLRDCISVKWIVKYLFILLGIGFSVMYLTLFIPASTTVMRLFVTTSVFIGIYLILILIFQRKTIETIFLGNRAIIPFLLSKLKK